MLPNMSVILDKSFEFVGAGSSAVPWHEALRRAIRDFSTLAEALGLPNHWQDQARQAAAQFRLLVPWEFLARMRRGDPDDPLLRQVLPVAEEMQSVAGYTADPLCEQESCRTPGLLQKYAGRALVIATGTCAVHCRYCFRRHFPYQELAAAQRRWPRILAELAADPTIEEVILSGGDPLVLPDACLEGWAKSLARLAHVQRLRVHTRLPIVIPQRVTSELLAWLRGTRLTTIVVVHVNHPQELDGACREALAMLVDRGIPVLNQSVLLRGVNDSVEALEQLCRELINLRVLPYYLHQLDPVEGAHHFAVPTEEAIALVTALRDRLPGYAVPRLVVEQPGEPSKRLLAG